MIGTRFSIFSLLVVHGIELGNVTFDRFAVFIWLCCIFVTFFLVDFMEFIVIKIIIISSLESLKCQIFFALLNVIFTVLF